MIMYLANNYIFILETLHFTLCLTPKKNSFLQNYNILLVAINSFLNNFVSAFIKKVVYFKLNILKITCFTNC